MRHRVGGRKLQRTSSHRAALFRNMPLKFAEKLYGLTTIGSPVVIEG